MLVVIFFGGIVDPFWLYALVFLIGYVTCQTFYFFKSTRVSLKLMKSGRVIYLLMMAKAMENYKIAEEVMLTNLKDSESDQIVIDRFKRGVEDERKSFKSKSVMWLINNTPQTFRDIIGFDDWDSAMQYLVLHQEEAYKFWRIDND